MFWRLQGGTEQLVDLSLVENDGQFSGGLGQLDLLERVVPEAVALGEKAVKGAQGGEMKPKAYEGDVPFELTLCNF